MKKVVGLIGALTALLSASTFAGQCTMPEGIHVRFGELSAFDTMYLARQEPAAAYPDWIDPTTGLRFSEAALYGRTGVIIRKPVGHSWKKDPRDANHHYQEWVFLALLDNCREAQLVMSQIDPEVRDWFEVAGMASTQNLPLEFVLHTYNVQPLDADGVRAGMSLIVKPRFDGVQYFGMLGPTWEHDSIDLEANTMLHVKDIWLRPVRNPKGSSAAPEGVMSVLVEVVTGPHAGKEALVPWRPDFLAKMNEWHSPSAPEFSAAIQAQELRSGMLGQDIVMAWGLPRYRVPIADLNKLGLKEVLAEGLGQVWPQTAAASGSREAWFYPGRIAGDPKKAFIIVEIDGSVLRSMQLQQDAVKSRFSTVSGVKN